MPPPRPSAFLILTAIIAFIQFRWLWNFPLHPQLSPASAGPLDYVPSLSWRKNRFESSTASSQPTKAMAISNTQQQENGVGRPLRSRRRRHRHGNATTPKRRPVSEPMRPQRRKRRPTVHKTNQNSTDGLAAHPYPFASPVLVLSLPKAGTTSLSRFFQCGGLVAPHTWGQRPDDGTSFRLGACMQDNFRAGTPLLRNCRPDVYHVYSDIGVLSRREGCFYPSIHALERLARDYPHATWILSYRTDWVEAVQRWQAGALWTKWAGLCSQFPNNTTPTEETQMQRRAFEWNHRVQIRRMVQRVPTLSFLEFDVADPTAGAQLANFTGIDASCWRNCKPTGGCEEAPKQ